MSSNEQVHKLLRCGATTSDARYELYDAIDQAEFFCPYWDRCGIPTPLAATNESGEHVLQLFTDENLAAESSPLSVKVWLDELSIREAVQWSHVNDWHRIVINPGPNQFEVTEEMMRSFENRARVA